MSQPVYCLLFNIHSYNQQNLPCLLLRLPVSVFLLTTIHLVTRVFIHLGLALSFSSIPFYQTFLFFPVAKHSSVPLSIAYRSLIKNTSRSVYSSLLALTSFIISFSFSFTDLSDSSVLQLSGILPHVLPLQEPATILNIKCINIAGPKVPFCSLFLPITRGKKDQNGVSERVSWKNEIEMPECGKQDAVRDVDCYLLNR